MQRAQHLRAALVFAASSLLGAACTSSHEPWWTDAPNYMVAADHADASRAGATILAAGGSAVDAAVATSFALAVVRPESCGLGGGGFMLIHRPGKPPVALDYRETIPARATLDNYLDDDGRPIKGRTRFGGWAVGVPGTVRGLIHALENYGSGRLSRREVLAPAIALARRPLVVDDHLHGAMANIAQTIASNPEYRRRFAVVYENVLRNGRPHPVGATIDRTAIASVLEAIANDGAAAFYTGDIAQRIVETVQADGGPLTRADLEARDLRALEPLTGRVAGLDILTMPPPSSGGAVLLEVLHTLDAAPGGLSAIDLNAPAGMHLLVEATKHGFADRARNLGDRSPQVMRDVHQMIDPAHAKTRFARINPDKTQPLVSYGSRRLPEDSGTSHFSVIDPAGMAVACTETINLHFGSLLMVEDTGIVLNNEIDDAAVDTTTPNAFGLRQSERNLIRPGRRPLSSMTPTIVLKNGRVELIVGASGGPRIITGTLQLLLNTLFRGITVDRAMAAPRLHHQWFPESLYIQPGFDPDVVSGLLDRGHVLARPDFPLGHVQAIARTPHGWRGACDLDKGGHPSGG